MSVPLQNFHNYNIMSPPQLATQPQPPRPTRVARACDQCIAKKTRCTGTMPCGTCTTKGRECSFNLPHVRAGRPIRKLSKPVMIDLGNGPVAVPVPGNIRPFDIPIVSVGAGVRPAGENFTRRNGEWRDVDGNGGPGGTSNTVVWDDVHGYRGLRHADRWSNEMNRSSGSVDAALGSNSLRTTSRIDEQSIFNLDTEPRILPPLEPLRTIQNTTHPMPGFLPRRGFHVLSPDSETSIEEEIDRAHCPEITFTDYSHSFSQNTHSSVDLTVHSSVSSIPITPQLPKPPRIVLPSLESSMAIPPPLISTDRDEDDTMEDHQRYGTVFAHRRHELAFDDDLPPLMDVSVQNLLIKNGLKLLGTILPSFNPISTDLNALPPIMQWSLQAAAFQLCAPTLETIQKGLSSPRNLYPLIERVKRSLCRVMDPTNPSKRGGTAVVLTSAFAPFSPNAWAEFIEVDRHIIKAVLCVCSALCKVKVLDGTGEAKLFVVGNSPKSTSRFWLSMAVDYAKRLGLHENVQKPRMFPDGPEDEKEIERTNKEAAERRNTWWSLYLFERAYFVLDEPAVRFSHIPSVPISPQGTNRQLTSLPFSALLRTFEAVPDPFPTRIAPLPIHVLHEGTSTTRAHWAALREHIHSICIATEKSHKACERLRMWASVAAMVHHVNAMGAMIARRMAAEGGEGWCWSSPDTTATGSQTGVDEFGFCNGNDDYEEFEELEEESDAERRDRVGANRLARMRTLVRKIEVVLAYNEQVRGPPPNPTLLVDAATYPHYFDHMFVSHRPLNVCAFIAFTSILTLAHSPSHILDQLVLNQNAQKGTVFRGIENTLSDKHTYAVLVRWARARNGGVLCFAQTLTLMRRMEGLLRAIERSEMHEEVFHRRKDPGMRCSDPWCAECEKQGVEGWKVGRSLMYTAPGAAVIWRCVAMAVVAWGVWSELGEEDVEDGVVGAAGNGDVEEGGAVSVERCREELVGGVGVVERWISKTLGFCESNDVYLERLKAIQGLVL
ncbi:hypothetical protein BJ742DRAFT_770122 [Cladochytrium replicatum]|nr:hypothetical protein BJ742DRAFT_770122 [Cladochytrium replicatum]